MSTIQSGEIENGKDDNETSSSLFYNSKKVLSKSSSLSSSLASFSSPVSAAGAIVTVDHNRSSIDGSIGNIATKDSCHNNNNKKKNVGGSVGSDSETPRNSNSIDEKNLFFGSSGSSLSSNDGQQQQQHTYSRRRKSKINNDTILNNNNNNNNGNNQQQQQQPCPIVHKRHGKFAPPRRMGSQVFLPRLVNRDMPFNQSQNRMAVKNINRKSIYKLLAYDWFHVLLRVNIITSCVILITIWTIMLLFFAGVYVWVDKIDSDCGLAATNTKIHFGGAFAFAMETATTVGYGLPGGGNAFFEAGCARVQSSIYFQMVFNMMFNAFMFAFFYSQLSKSETRSIQIVFSDKLVISLDEDTNTVSASVRCYDLDSAHPLVEAHTRMYLLDHKLKLKPLRITVPDDDNGAFMLPSMPLEIKHHVDHHSALSPRGMPLTMPSSTDKSTIPLRSIDSVTGSRPEIICPICGDTFSSYEHLKVHVDYNKFIEEQEGYNSTSSQSSSQPQKLLHHSFVMPDITPISLQEVQKHIERTLSEIIVVVEAIDPQLSGTFQALQSYKYTNIEFGADFQHCMAIKDNKIAVDMDKFHRIKYNERSMEFYQCMGTMQDCFEATENENKDHAHDHSFHQRGEELTLSKLLEDDDNDIDVDDDDNRRNTPGDNNKHVLFSSSWNGLSASATSQYKPSV